MHQQYKNLILNVLSGAYTTAGEDAVVSQIQTPIPIKIFFRKRMLLESSLQLRRIGPEYLKLVSVNRVSSLLTNFLLNNLVEFVNFDFDFREAYQFSNLIDESAVDEITQRFLSSGALLPTYRSFFFPLTGVTIEERVRGNLFQLLSPDQLAYDVGEPQNSKFLADQFPPWLKKGNRQKVSAWLQIKSPLTEVAQKQKAVILGSILLSIIQTYRHQFTMRETISGFASGEEKPSTIHHSGFEMPHIPPFSGEVNLNPTHDEWLYEIDALLEPVDNISLRNSKSLEYFYRSWFLKEAEKFPVECMAMDAVFGDATEATKSVVDGVCELMEGTVDPRRINSLMRIRASVIHGGAPDVYSSKKYAKYVSRFGADPVSDMSILLAECLRRKVFGKSFRIQPDPFQQYIDQAMKMGLHTGEVRKEGILDFSNE